MTVKTTSALSDRNDGNWELEPVREQTGASLTGTSGGGLGGRAVAPAPLGHPEAPGRGRLAGTVPRDALQVRAGRPGPQEAASVAVVHTEMRLLTSF